MAEYLLKVEDSIRQRILGSHGTEDTPLPTNFQRELERMGYGVGFRYNRKEIEQYGFIVLETDRELGDDAVDLLMKLGNYGFTEMRLPGTSAGKEWGY